MANRERTVPLFLYVTQQEADLIRERMTRVGTTNFSLYARKMLLDGYIIRHDAGAVKELTKELSNLARSINQIALRVNETRSIYQTDVEDLRQMYAEVKSRVSERLVKLVNED